MFCVVARSFHGPSYTIESQWGNFGTLLPPGVQLLPHLRYGLTEPVSLFKVANFTFLRNPLSELWVCEFWLLRCSTMVARAWPVCWGDSGLAACCPESNEPTLMFLWHFYPEISLWSLSMEVYGTSIEMLRCWWDPMILRCWLVVWVKWARPLSLWHCDTELCSIEKRFLFISGPSYTIESQWGNFGTLLPPRGATFTPFWGMVLQSLPASSNVANFTFLWNPLSELRGVKVFRNVKSMRFFWPLFRPWGEHRTPDRL